MIWRDGDSRISSDMVALVWPSPAFGPWAARVEANNGAMVWRGQGYESEDAAKAGVIAWMDKTCTQFQNIKAANCQPVDEE